MFLDVDHGFTNRNCYMHNLACIDPLMNPYHTRKPRSVLPNLQVKIAHRQSGHE